MANRPKYKPVRKQRGRYPSPDSVVELRVAIQERGNLGITDAQKDCATMLHTSLRAYQKWERGEANMHPAFWELFRLKVAQFLGHKTNEVA